MVRKKIIDSVNPILYGVFNQCILHGEDDKNVPNLTPTQQVMGTPNLACGLVFTKIFQKNWF